MNEVKLHVQSLNGFFDDALRMARRIDAGDYSAQTATIGFATMELLLKALTPNRWVLLRSLKRSGKTSIRKLANILTRDYRGVHADVIALIKTGLIERDADGLISVPWSRITAEMSVEMAA